jgi:hypothetical protein
MQVVLGTTGVGMSVYTLASSRGVQCIELKYIDGQLISALVNLWLGNYSLQHSTSSI